LRDAEDYYDALRAIELLGAAETGRVGTLKSYKRPLMEIAKRSATFESARRDRTGRFTSPDRLYSLLEGARNEAMHHGAYARLLARHCVDFCLMLEDGLVSNSDVIDDFIVREPVIAELWQPLSLVRQVMLRNSFTWLPIKNEDGLWQLIGDAGVARMLRGVPNSGARKDRLAMTVGEAIANRELTLVEPLRVKPGTPVSQILKSQDWNVVLVVLDGRVIGMATPFDLL
jgi:CBS domain-containing protein